MWHSTRHWVACSSNPGVGGIFPLSLALFCCMYVCMFVFPHPVSKTVFAKNSPYVRNKFYIYIEPVLIFQAAKLWFEPGNTCRFEIRMKRVYKDTVKARLYGHQIAEKQHSWPPTLLDITISSS